MRDADGNLTPAAIEVLNNAAIDAPHAMYPLSQVAADLGREGFVLITHGEKAGRNRMWNIAITEAGWAFVTDEEALHQHRKEVAFTRLGGRIEA